MRSHLYCIESNGEGVETDRAKEGENEQWKEEIRQYLKYRNKFLLHKDHKFIITYASTFIDITFRKQL
jgi:hypothetical protein